MTMSPLLCLVCALATFSVPVWGKSIPDSASDSKKRIAVNQPTSKVQRPKVRIKLVISHLAPVGMDRSGKLQFGPKRSTTHFLKADMVKKNHFYLDNFHVITEPRQWVKGSHLYRTRVSLLKRYGRYKDLEELAGFVDVGGKLKPEGANTFRLMAQASKRFFHPSGQPHFDMSAGTPEAVRIPKGMQMPRNTIPVARGTQRQPLKVSKRSAKEE